MIVDLVVKHSICVFRCDLRIFVDENDVSFVELVLRAVRHDEQPILLAVP